LKSGTERHRQQWSCHPYALYLRKRIEPLSVIDEYRRECLALEVERSMGANDVVEVLMELSQVRGVPKHIRSDNGPEFIAVANHPSMPKQDVSIGRDIAS
jgi:hypothetical protein